jgi:hypothetical protein
MSSGTFTFGIERRRCSGALRFALAAALLFGMAGAARGQVSPSRMNAKSDDPVYTTYAAPMSRSEYFVDEGYHLNFYTPGQGISYTTDTAGAFGIAWQLGDGVAPGVEHFSQRPILRRSYTDIAQLDYRPFPMIRVRETFVVYSSRVAFVDVQVTNESGRARDLIANAWFRRAEPVTGAAVTGKRMVTFGHVEPANLWFETPQPKYDPNFHDVFLLSAPAEVLGGFAQGDPVDALRQHAGLGGAIGGKLRGFVLSENISVPAHGHARFRIVRGVAPASQNIGALEKQARALLRQPVAPLLTESRAQYRRVPRLQLPNRDWQMVYWSALSLVRQQMMPAEGMSSYNYYVFSREPTWRWGHEGQVFHESLSMLAYAARLHAAAGALRLHRLPRRAVRHADVSGEGRADDISAVFFVDELGAVPGVARPEIPGGLLSLGQRVCELSAEDP